ALKRAQRDIDLRPDRYTHYYKKEFPTRWHAQMDTRRWGPGERLVFEPYTKEAFEESFERIAQHQIFAGADMGQAKYERSALTLGSWRKPASYRAPRGPLRGAPHFEGHYRSQSAKSRDPPASRSLHSSAPAILSPYACSPGRITPGLIDAAGSQDGNE